MNLTVSEYQKIRNWMYRNARPLDIARWKYHFEGGSRETVLEALMVYQNKDGGFGNALEADSWNPASSPISTCSAIIILNEVSFNDMKHPIIMEILRYLENTPDFNGETWPAVIASNNDYPHAPWWTYSEKEPYDFGYNPTALLAGFILLYAGKDTDIRIKAEKIAKSAIDEYINGVLPNGEAYSSVKREGEVSCFHYLLVCLKAAKLTHLYNTAGLRSILKKQADAAIERDSSKWNQYCCKPSAFIGSPDSMFYEGNKDILDVELNYILSSRNKDGVWDINWSWGDYDQEFAISGNWWKANMVISNMLLLKNFKRV